MNIGRMLPAQHGSCEAVVRGTIVEIVPAKPATGWFKWLRRSEPVGIRVRIDDEPYSALERLVPGRVTQIFSVGWNILEPMPVREDRVWVTFGYASEVETFVRGAPPFSLKGVKMIQDERETQPNEIGISDQLPLRLFA